MPTVAYSSFLCPKDIERGLPQYPIHLKSHNYPFDEKFLILQRCQWPLNPELQDLYNREFKDPIIVSQIHDYDDYRQILSEFGLPTENAVYDELTHGQSAPHYWKNHLVNHLRTIQLAKSDYIVFSDGDCYVKDQLPGKSWVTEGIRKLQSDPSIFVVSPSDGRPHAERDSMMSQQMFLVNTKQMREMEYIPWDGKFIEGGPFQEFYALLEGFIYRHMKKNGLYRYLLTTEYRWWHLEWH